MRRMIPSARPWQGYSAVRPIKPTTHFPNRCRSLRTRHGVRPGIVLRPNTGFDEVMVNVSHLLPEEIEIIFATASDRW